MEIKPLGVSNELFYFTQVGDKTYTICYTYYFKEEFHLDKFIKAANDALTLFPEFSIRPVINGNRIYARQQNVPIVFIEDDGTYLEFGSDDTNGYMFCFRYGEKHVTVSFYHGLSDIKGITPFLTEIMYRYAKSCNVIFTEEEEAELSKIRRSTAPIFTEDNELQMLDPYKAYLKMNGDTDYKENRNSDNSGSKDIFCISDNCVMNSELVRHHTIEFRTSDFIKKTKELQVSFIPLLHEIISSALMKAFNTQTRVVANVPADMRQVLQMETLANFSDGIRIPYERDDLGNDVSLNCAKFKDIMMGQMNREHFAGIISEKVRRIESAEEESGLSAKAKKAQYTYVLTYPGKITFSESIDNMFEDVHFICRPGFITVLVYTFKDAMRLELLIRSEDETFSNGIFEGVKNHGLKAELFDRGYLYSDKVNLEKFTHIGV